MALRECDTLVYDCSHWMICGTFFSIINKENQLATPESGRKKNYGEERKDQDWNSLWLFFSLSIFFFSPKEGREKEATGDLLDYQCDAHGLKEPEKKEGGDVLGGVKGKGAGVRRRDWCVHFLPSLLQAVDFHTGFTFFFARCVGAEECAKTPPTTAWKSGGGWELTPVSPVNEERTKTGTSCE